MSWDYDTSEPQAQDTGSGDRLNPRDILGHLLLVWAIDYIPDSPTRFTQPGKQSDVVVVDVVDLDLADPHTGAPGYVMRKSWWRQAQLIRDFKSAIGKPNPKICSLSLGIPTKGMAPFVVELRHADPVARGRADAWRQQNLGFTPSVANGMAAPAAPFVTPGETQLEMMARQSATGTPYPPQGSQRLVTNVDQYGRPLSTPPRPPLPQDPPF